MIAAKYIETKEICFNIPSQSWGVFSQEPRDGASQNFCALFIHETSAISYADWRARGTINHLFFVRELSL